jgi:hypothetical protein
MRGAGVWTFHWTLVVLAKTRLCVTEGYVECGDKSPASGGTAGAALDVRGAHPRTGTDGLASAGSMSHWQNDSRRAASGAARRSAPIQSGAGGTTLGVAPLPPRSTWRRDTVSIFRLICLPAGRKCPNSRAPLCGAGPATSGWVPWVSPTATNICPLSGTPHFGKCPIPKARRSGARR